MFQSVGSAETRPSVHRELFHLLLTKAFAFTQRRKWTQLQGYQWCPTAVWSHKMNKCISLPISWSHDSCEIKSDSCTGLLQIKGLTSSKNHPTEDRGPASAFSIVRALKSIRNFMAFPCLSRFRQHLWVSTAYFWHVHIGPYATDHLRSFIRILQPFKKQPNGFREGCNRASCISTQLLCCF